MSGDGGHASHRRTALKRIDHGVLTRLKRRFALLLLAVVLLVPGRAPAAPPALMRIELHLAAGARSSPHLLLLTVGGPVYCAQLENLARHTHASLACTDYGPNRYVRAGGRAGRREDWGDPAYLDLVARLPGKLRAQGVQISKLIVGGVSYSGFGNAQLVATHPELQADALIVVDSYLDLAARFRALPLHHETRAEIDTVLGGTPDEKPREYADRSPSHHLGGLARDHAVADGGADALAGAALHSRPPVHPRRLLRTGRPRSAQPDPPAPAGARGGAVRIAWESQGQGAPLLLGSWWGLLAGALMIVLIGVRAVLEERMLTAELEGYAEYAERVRYRLVPRVW